MSKVVLLILFLLVSFEKVLTEDKLPSIKTICNDIEYEIQDLELMKNNLKKEFKLKNDELQQFELLPELTKDVNNTIKQQILQAKLYHYLDCSRFKM